MYLEIQNLSKTISKKSHSKEYYHWDGAWENLWPARKKRFWKNHADAGYLRVDSSN